MTNDLNLKNLSTEKWIRIIFTSILTPLITYWIVFSLFWTGAGAVAKVIYIIAVFLVAFFYSIAKASEKKK